jgi:hypothetical protein
MATFKIENPPKDLQMTNFRAIIDNYGALAKQCRYYVRILPAGVNNKLRDLGYNYMLNEMSYLCDAAELPGRSFDVSETRYYGPGLVVPHNTKYSGEISLSFLTRTEGYERQMFDDWMGIINPINNFNFEYAKNYYATIQVFQLSEAPAEGDLRATAPKATYMWSLQNAWPATVTPQPVTWADNDVLRLSVSFIYQFWTRPGRDATPGGEPGQIPNIWQRNSG